MPNLNKVLLMGNLTRAPETRYTTGGLAICGLGLAMNRRFSTRSGEDREETCFVDIDVFGKPAESCQAHLQKGSPVFIEGRLRLDQWEDRKTGQSRSKLKIVAERVEFLGSRRDSGSAAPGTDDAPAGPAPARPNAGDDEPVGDTVPF